MNLHRLSWAADHLWVHDFEAAIAVTEKSLDVLQTGAVGLGPARGNRTEGGNRAAVTARWGD